MSGAPPEARLEAAGLWHRYGPERGLEPVNFSIASPGVTAVTGPNGSGKSTLLRIIAGLLRPSGGRVSLELGGRPLDRDARRAAIGLASPELMFYDEFSVAENLVFAGEARGMSDPAGAARRALEAVGLAVRADDRVTALSSGMKQRLRLAFALMHEPAVLLLDEPGSHMDEAGRTVVAEIAARHGRAGLVVIATNDERERNLAGQQVELSGRGLGHSA